MRPRPSRLVLLGHPVSHSLSATFQNAALRCLGVPLRYEALDVAPADVAATIERLTTEGAAGNVTIPHKGTVCARCDRLTAIAERVRAVNTFWVDETGALVGDNTDVDGFAHLAAQTAGGVPRNVRVALLGAGGAAAAVLAAVERWVGSSVTLWSRSVERRDALARRFPVVARVADDARAGVRDASVVINATPVGMADDALPVPVEALAPGAVVLDLVYRPGGTPWVRQAREHGHAAADGLAMLVEQGALAFERWLGVPAPRDVMRRAAAGAR